MQKKDENLLIIILIIFCLLITSIIAPVISGFNINNIKGFDKGPSYTSVVPLEKITFVNFDEDTYIDDYAYLAAVPTTVFKDADKLYSNPLLFYQDEYPVKEDKERSLNTRVGIDCFMEDWMEYCNYELDKMTLINVPENKLDSSWKYNDLKEIESDDPYEISSKLALSEWSYSKNAVIATIDEEFEKSNEIFEGEIEGKLNKNTKIIQLDPFYTTQLDKLNPRPNYFKIPSENYKFLYSRTWWSSIWFGTPQKSDLPVHINITIPAADPDSQFYCKNENGQWMEVAVTQGWNIGGMDKEKTQTYIYDDGEWYFTITDIPTFKIRDIIGSFGTPRDILRNMLSDTRYQTDITLFPGVDLEIPDNPPFGCRDIKFELISERDDVKLGFSVIGPSGEEIMSSVKKDLTAEESDTYELNLGQLGECPKEKKYKVSVYLLEDINQDLDFKLKYSWHQNITQEEGDALSSATEGAVLASSLNAPLLYTSSDNLDKKTEEVLYKLGVENIYLVNLGKHLKKDVKNKINNIAEISEEYTKLTHIYDKITSITNQNDIIFSTIDPWSWYYVEECKPVGETKAGLFIGPAAYTAAHHGSPVLIVDMHPELSSNVVWHTEFWKKHSRGHPEPTVACMFLTINPIIEFLKDIGLNKEGLESMITVADQYEIGATWDRAFVGNTKPGRFFGSPVDTAYFISRNIFYPALIFCNPAMDTEGVKLIQGDSSQRRKLFPWGKLGLKISSGEEETFNYPVVQLYLTYSHHLNDRFSKYYGFKYECADGIIPGQTSSNDPIDSGVVPDKPGQQIWPDFTISEVTPYYLEKGGFDNVFSTNFDVMTENLNKGALLLLSSSHGTGGGSGKMHSWNPELSAISIITGGRKIAGFQNQENPWRGYDWLMGSTEKPDAMTMEVHGFIPAFLGNPNIDGFMPTGEDFWPNEKPIVHTIGKILNAIPIVKWFIPEWLADSTYYKDGMIGAHTISGLATTVQDWTGYNWDKKLENTHSCGWLNGACLPAYKLMHLTMVRHGSAFQIIDPWATSWYMYWMQTIPKDITLGHTMGEAYTRGISHVGILYSTDPPQWWWDSEQNLIYFGDPDLRIFVPETKYSDNNNWNREDVKTIGYDPEINIDGHMPFGATEFPNEKEPQSYIILLIMAILLIVIIVIIIIALSKHKKS